MEKVNLKHFFEKAGFEKKEGKDYWSGYFDHFHVKLWEDGKVSVGTTLDAIKLDADKEYPSTVVDYLRTQIIDKLP